MRRTPHHEAPQQLTLIDRFDRACNNRIGQFRSWHLLGYREGCSIAPQISPAFGPPFGW